jgi:hypothetical protein
VEEDERLERTFDAAMFDIYHLASRLGYRPTRFLEMVREYRGVQAAHRLLADPGAQSGLTELWLLGRPGLSMEHLVCSDACASLFSVEERHRARGRLDVISIPRGRA